MPVAQRNRTGPQARSGRRCSATKCCSLRLRRGARGRWKILVLWS